MNKLELVALAEKLSELDDLTGHAGEVALLKKEWKRFNRESDDDSFADNELAEKFNVFYAKIAEKEGSLFASTYDEKKAIVEKAKELLKETNFKKATEEMNALFEAFKTAGRCTKEQDDELWTEFKAIKDEFYNNKKAYFQALGERFAASKAKKEELIEEAKKVLEEENFKVANEKMNALFEEWKKSGYAGKEDDNALWEAFSAVRKSFFAKRKEYNENLKTIFEERVAKKEEIIAKAKILLANSNFTKEEIEEAKALRTAWKEIGFSGKDHDDDLWNRFQTVLNKYFEELKASK